jgi:hypothetical protein
VKIERIEAIPIEIPLTRNFGGSTYAVIKRSTIVTRLRTDAGLVSEVYPGFELVLDEAMIRRYRADQR